MVERTYHLSDDGMIAFTETLESIMEPFETHCRRYLLLLEKMNERCFSVSAKGVQIVMQSVAMFPDMRDACQKTLNGFADITETQDQLFEAIKDIHKDIGTVHEGYMNLLKSLMESCESVD